MFSWVPVIAAASCVLDVNSGTKAGWVGMRQFPESETCRRGSYIRASPVPFAAGGGDAGGGVQVAKDRPQTALVPGGQCPLEYLGGELGVGHGAGRPTECTLNPPCPPASQRTQQRRTPAPTGWRVIHNRRRARAMATPAFCGRPGPDGAVSARWRRGPDTMPSSAPQPACGRPRASFPLPGAPIPLRGRRVAGQGENIPGMYLDGPWMAATAIAASGQGMMVTRACLDRQDASGEMADNGRAD